MAGALRTTQQDSGCMLSPQEQVLVRGYADMGTVQLSAAVRACRLCAVRGVPRVLPRVACCHRDMRGSYVTLLRELTHTDIVTHPLTLSRTAAWTELYP